ncbi:spermine synthase-like isoform X3 [Ceratina calcarata]|uniref:Spermine synthase-like isoform X3 n=1 Tax=Ceratina calcarata TaxID=156304 RepID=A0AAJ7J340_9HYME|nr:spermine synthase-like isoform X3 [Ceratina calcarata]
MVAHTVLLDFSVSSDVVLDEKKRSNLKSAIANVLQEHFNGLKPLTESNIDGSFLVLYTGPKGSLITVRGYTEGLITINIEYYKRDEEEALLDFELARELETALQAAAASTRSHSLSPIKRGGPFDRYFPTAGEFFYLLFCLR